MRLLIAIPALNEEESIESIIQRSLDARAEITTNSAVTEVCITVVSDGSTDRTVELASRFLDQIKLIVFEKNRGYGAAIQEAWRQSDADLLSFIDADGTCDPRFFAQLCDVLDKQKADVILGCRLNSDSKMPLIRKIGNSLFAALLTVLSSKRVRDTASGMRVVRRSSLPDLMPLPTGMHFTPAMSARAMLNSKVKIIEIDMPYHEREGQSKLRVFRDGVRFLRVIVEAAFLYQPSRLLNLGATLSLLIAIVIMIEPTLYYLANRSLLEWMIYRFITCSLLGSTAFLLFCASYLSERIVSLVFSTKIEENPRVRWLNAFFRHRYFLLLPGLLFLIGGLLVLPSFVSLLTTGAIYEHWSRFVAMSFLFQIAIFQIVTRIIDYILDLISLQLAYLRSASSQEQSLPRSEMTPYYPSSR